MAGKTFSGTYSSTILLTNTAQSPVTLTGSISAHGTNAQSDSGFYSSLSFAWTINNLGRITTTGATSYGIALLGGGTIINGQAGSTLGSIQSDETGILLTGAAGAVSNFGSIVGTLGRGVFLEDGGTLANGGSGAAGALIQGGFEGVAIYNAGGMLTNAGTILATGSSGFGVELYAGTVSNLAGGQIGGTYGAGFVARATYGTLTNAGTITGRGRDGVALTGGGVVMNSGSIYGAINGVLALYGGARVTNTGGITGVYAGIDLLDGGTVVNRIAGTVTGGFGVSIGNGATAGVAGTITNAGVLRGMTDEGVALNAGGMLTNTGSIYGALAGVAGFYAPVTVTNMGRIGSPEIGVDLIAGGILTNAAAAVIAAQYGVLLGSNPSGVPAPVASSLSNAGVISGAGSYGVKLLTNGVFDNLVGGTISGGQYGVYVQTVTGTLANYGVISGQVGVYGREVVANGTQYHGQVTVLNAGTISGSGGTSVSLFASNDLLIDEPGAVFVGGVNGGGGRLELAAGHGVIGAVGSNIASFATVTVDAGATWTLSGALSATGTLLNEGVVTVAGSVLQTRGTVAGPGTISIGHLGAVIGGTTIQAGSVIAFSDPTAKLELGRPLQDAGTQSGFAAGQLIYLFNTPLSGLTKSYAGNSSGGTLTLSEGGTLVANLVFRGNYTAATFSLAADHGGGTDLFIPCFLAGTRIATPGGAMAVERLRAGMVVLTISGEAREVVWVGRRGVDVGRHAEPDSVRPVRILRGAFAAGVPERDLLLSPDHAVLHDGVLIPVHLLVNGTSVRREPVGYARYHHVELASHDILLAEGLAAESYLDTGNRGLFGQGGGTAGAPAGEPCRTMALGGAAVARARRHLLARARRREVVVPAIGLEADGRALAPARRIGARLLYVLPAGTQVVRVTPGSAQVVAAILDGRVLMNADVGQVTYSDRARSLELIPAPDPGADCGRLADLVSAGA